MVTHSSRVPTTHHRCRSQASITLSRRGTESAKFLVAGGGSPKPWVEFARDSPLEEGVSWEARRRPSQHSVRSGPGAAGKGVRLLRAIKAEQLRAEKKAHDATDEGQAIAPLVRNRRFESTSLQRRVSCELDPRLRRPASCNQEFRTLGPPSRQRD